MNDGTSHLLLDGQQRLATATILLSVIRDAFAEFNQDAAAQVSNKYITEVDHATNTYSYKLTLNGFDRDFYRREVQEYPAPTPMDPELGSHSLVRGAKHFFQGRFEEARGQLAAGMPQYEWARRILRILTGHVSVVAVSSTDEDNAAAVFETLNDRGIGLSTPDLLRNLVLRRANAAEYDEILECWRVVLEVEEEAYVDNFLRHFWISLNGDIKQRSLYREIKDEVTTKDIASVELSRKLREAAETYKDIVAGRDDDVELRKLLEDVSMLGAKALLPAVLSAYTLAEVEARRRVVRALVTTFVRHTLIGQLQNSRLESVVFGLAKELRDSQDADSAIESLRKLIPDDDAFLERFRSVSIARQKSARYVLRKLEEAARETAELEVSTPDRVHLEHIYPRTPLDGARLGNHDAMVNRLGNLTLLDARLNMAIRNSTFADKKPAYETSEILITKGLSELGSWGADGIAGRQTQLAESALAIWPLPE